MSVSLTIIFRNTCNTSRADILLLHSITVLWLAICKYIILCCSNFLYFPLLYAAGAPRFLHALGFQPRLVEMTGRGGSTAPFYLSFEKGGGGGIKAAERSLLRSAAFMFRKYPITKIKRCTVRCTALYWRIYYPFKTADSEKYFSWTELTVFFLLFVLRSITRFGKIFSFPFTVLLAPMIQVLLFFNVILLCFASSDISHLLYQDKSFVLWDRLLRFRQCRFFYPYPLKKFFKFCFPRKSFFQCLG